MYASTENIKNKSVLRDFTTGMYDTYVCIQSWEFQVSRACEFVDRRWFIIDRRGILVEDLWTIGMEIELRLLDRKLQSEVFVILEILTSTILVEFKNFVAVLAAIFWVIWLQKRHSVTVVNLLQC